MTRINRFFAAMFAVLLSLTFAMPASAQTPPTSTRPNSTRASTRPISAGPPITPATDGKPTLWLVGDSTVRNGTRPNYGWGEVLDHWFDLSKIHVQDLAIAGRSTRTYVGEGRWDRLMAAALPGDFVLIQMGHNDGGAPDRPPYRGSLPGLSDETLDFTNPNTGRQETIHAFGWYLSKFIKESQAKQMTAIICSPIPHCPTAPVQANTLEQNKGATWTMVTWSEQAAAAGHAPFIQLNGLILSHFVGMDPKEIKTKYYSTADNTHTNGPGAVLNAQCVADGIRALADCALKNYLRDAPEPMVFPTTRAASNP